MMTEQEMDLIWDKIHLARKKRKRDVRTGSALAGLFVVGICALATHMVKGYTWSDAFVIGALCGAMYILGVYHGFQAGDDEHIIRTRDE